MSGTVMSNLESSPFPFFDSNAEAYGLRCRSIALGDAPVGCMMCEVGPGQQSRIHNHFEAEVFLFLHGAGVFLSDGRETMVGPGQSIVAKPFSNHVVRNDDAAAPLYFVSVYWDSKPLEDGKTATCDALIFSTPPTPNGDLHLGHLSGPYLAADVYRRHLEQQGAHALHVSGRDDHQTYVMRKALAGGGRGGLCAADPTNAHGKQYPA
jgi:methionyl-tRNA synthetase